MTLPIRLGVNVDHVATVRNARGGQHPDPVQAAGLAVAAGADSITAHLREDRRHILDDDIFRLKETLSVPLNFEMAATEEMVQIAAKVLPRAACLVPEKREELTTEGGLDVVAGHNRLRPIVSTLTGKGIRVSLFIEADPAQLEAAAAIGAPVIELHAGAYCDADPAERPEHLDRIQKAAAQAERLGLECHVGHGLNFETVEAIAAIPTVAELNIGHFLVGEGIFIGLQESVRRMRTLMDKARAEIQS